MCHRPGPARPDARPDRWRCGRPQPRPARPWTASPPRMSPDLASALALACHRDHLTDRNANIPVDLPAVWATLGQLTRAEALAPSITYPARQATPWRGCRGPGRDRTARAGCEPWPARSPTQLGRRRPSLGSRGPGRDRAAPAGRAVASRSSTRIAGRGSGPGRGGAGPGRVCTRAGTAGRQAEALARSITDPARQADALPRSRSRWPAPGSTSGPRRPPLHHRPGLAGGGSGAGRGRTRRSRAAPAGRGCRLLDHRPGRQAQRPGPGRGRAGPGRAAPAGRGGGLLDHRPALAGAGPARIAVALAEAWAAPAGRSCSPARSPTRPGGRSPWRESRRPRPKPGSTIRPMLVAGSIPIPYCQADALA